MVNRRLQCDDPALAHALRALPDPQAWLNEQTRLKQDRDSAVYRASLAGRELVIKQYRARHLGGRLRQWLGLGRGHHGWRISRLVQGHSTVSMPTPLAWWLGPWGELLISEAIADARDLRAWQDDAESRRALFRRHQVPQRLLAQLAQLHQAGFAHGDFKWPNALLNPESGALWIIDWDGAARVHGELGRAQAKDLARFFVNALEQGYREDELEPWWQQYAEQRQLPLARVKRRVMPLLGRILERHRQQYGAP